MCSPKELRSDVTDSTAKITDENIFYYFIYLFFFEIRSNLPCWDYMTILNTTHLFISAMALINATVHILSFFICCSDYLFRITICSASVNLASQSVYKSSPAYGLDWPFESQQKKTIIIWKMQWFHAVSKAFCWLRNVLVLTWTWRIGFSTVEFSLWFLKCLNRDTKSNFIKECVRLTLLRQQSSQQVSSLPVNPLCAVTPDFTSQLVSKVITCFVDS